MPVSRARVRGDEVFVFRDDMTEILQRISAISDAASNRATDTLIKMGKRKKGKA
jgi:hypothetical protein